MSQRRSHAVAASVGGRLWVCGGKGSGAAERLCSAERLDTSTSRWVPLPPMLEPRSQAAAAVVGGALHVCGGFDGVQHLRSAERLSPGAGAWRRLPAMNEGRSSAAAAALAGRLYICGGYDGEQVLRTVEVYDARSNAWVAGSAPPMLVARAHATATTLWSMPGALCSDAVRGEPVPK